MVKVTLEGSLEAQRNSGAIPLNLGGGMVNNTPRPLYPREIKPVPIVQVAAWVLMCTGNLSPIGIRSLDGPARIQSLCRPSYLGTSL